MTSDDYAHAGGGFMGCSWDSFVPGPATWREVFRVLRPGAHLLAFSSTRTADLMTVAIRMAGFETRDCIRHERSLADEWVGYLFGDRFPKSADVPKVIDMRRTEDAEPVCAVCRAIRAAIDARALKSRDLTAALGDCHPRLIDHWAARDTGTQPSLPT